MTLEEIILKSDCKDDDYVVVSINQRAKLNNHKVSFSHCKEIDVLVKNPLKVKNG